MLPRFAVSRPVTVLMAVLAVATFGVLSARRLPVELLPNLSYPTLTVQTEYEDAAPEPVEQFVTRPIEEAVGVIPGVRDMRSTSRAGLSEVTLEFDWGERMDFAALDVRERLGLVELPREADVPRVLRFDPSLEPVMRLAFTGDRPLDELRQLSERWLKPRLEAVKGVAAAKVRGGLDPEIVVEADEDRLAALGLTLDDLGRALEAENVNLAGGTLRDFNAVYLVRTLHEFEDLEQIRRTVVREGPQGRVRVEDVADVSRGHRDRDEIVHVDGREVVGIDLHREGSANTVTVAEEVRAALAALDEEMSDDLGLVVLADQSRYIAAAVGEVWNAALIGGLLAVVVLYFFLRDPRATAIIALTIPVSVVATFLLMRQAGVSLNIMSLGGLALGIGMLVDNSIVVLEAVDRRRHEGLARRDAAVVGAGEVSGAVTAATLTTVSVFLPIIFVQGVAGQLFYDQAVTVCLSLLTSLLVSLTLIPALSAFEAGRYAAPTLIRWDEATPDERRPMTFRLGGLALPPVGDGRHLVSKLLTVLLFPLRLLILLAALAVGAAWWAFSWAFHIVAAPPARGFDAVGSAYPGTLRRALRRRWLVLAVAVAIFAVSIAVLPMIGTSLVPELAQGEFAFQLRFPEGTPLESTAEVVGRIERMLAGEPLFARVFSISGSLPAAASGRRTLGENLAQVDISLVPQAGAEEEAAAVARVRSALAALPQVDAELVRPAVVSVQPPIAVQVFSDDLDLLDDAADRVRRALEELAVLKDVATTAEPGNPEIQVELDRERAAALGVSAADVGAALRGKVRGEVVGEFREGEERIDIRVRAEESFRTRASEVEALRLVLPGGTAVPVSAVADVTVGRGPAAIYRSGGARVAEITAVPAGADLGEALAVVESRLDRLEGSLPPAVSVAVGGQNREMETSFQSLWLALGLATFLVYVVMAAQFESLLHPFVILMAVPLGAVGVVAALLVTGIDISVLVLIGAVMLAGIVVNNAIVLIDAVNRRRREGEPLEEAIVGAGSERLRPILMTTTTTILALLPMAVGLGAGDELRAPLAVTVIGGLLVSTVLTLVVTPCLYRAMSSARRDDAGTGGAGAPDDALEQTA